MTGLSDLGHKDSALTLYLLQRRGRGTGDRAMIVGALTEAHARVAAYNRSKDVAWAEDSASACIEIVASEGVLHTVYVSEPD